MNPLEDRPDLRKILYTVQYVVSGAMLLLGVAWATLPEQGVPQWYITASAVLSALWAYTGLTAAQNVPGTPDLPDDTPLESDEMDPDTPWTDGAPEDDGAALPVEYEGRAAGDVSLS